MEIMARGEITRILNNLVEWADAEDADMLIDLLLETTDLNGAYTWLFFHNHELGGTPLHLMEAGYTRQVFKQARQMVQRGAA